MASSNLRSPFNLPLAAAMVSFIACGLTLAGVMTLPTDRFADKGQALASTVTSTDSSGKTLPMVHELTRYEGASLVAPATLNNLTSSKTDSEIRLRIKGVVERNFPVIGEWVGPEVNTSFNFSELLPSWNVITPPDTGARFDVRVKDAQTGEWSPWMYMGNWGRVPQRKQEIKFPGGKVEVDILELTRPASTYQMRATLFSFDPTGQTSPELRRVSVSHSAYVASANKRDLIRGTPNSDADFRRDLPVPFRAQGVELQNLSSEICSPTSVAMLMQFAGKYVPTRDTALSIYDPEYDLFGNWNRAVAMAGSLGLDAYLTRISTIDDARRYVANGQPLIASIRFKDGEFPSNVMKSTAGHLIVIRGFNSQGDAIVNDPASRERGNGIIYKADELERAWIDSASGVAYVIARRGLLK